mmetsp:Transcript_11883/g.28427  ORF Transcript_11883/g.28427 Transcript_11883/m.28427 type:complete len:231 (+) Transcript_11883:193-885(+)
MAPGFDTRHSNYSSQTPPSNMKQFLVKGSKSSSSSPASSKQASKACASALQSDVLLSVLVSRNFSCAQLCQLSNVCRGWRELLGQSQELWIHISFCPFEMNVNGKVLEQVLPPSRLKNVRTLVLKDCQHLTSSDIVAIFHKLGPDPLLETLDLSGCRGATDAVLMELLRIRCPLKYLGLNRLLSISVTPLRRLVAATPSLKILEAEGASLSPRTRCLVDTGRFKVLQLGL